MSQSFNILKQPRPFYLIFFIELWERFGYYGLQALLSIYLVRQLGMEDDDAFITFGAFSALVYGLVVVGGYVGDNIFGTRRTMVLGALVMMAGYFLMALSGDKVMVVYLALGTIAVGNGLFKANPSSLLAKFYKEGDSRLDGAFTLYYMAVNIGSFFSISLAPYIAEYFGWSVGFMASAIGLLVAVSNYFFMHRWLAEYGSEPDFQPVPWSTRFGLYLGVLVACGASAWILDHLKVANVLLALVSFGALVIYFREMQQANSGERRKMGVVLILMLEAVIFFVMYMQMPTSLNFFAIKNVEPIVLGITINPVTFQSLNPFWIMVASPVMAWFYNRNEAGGGGLTMPTKFALGMLFTGGSFLVLPLGAIWANDQGIVSSGWLVLSYFFQAIGELLISGLGLAMVAQLVPDRLYGFIMGVWFLTSSAASVVAGYVAGLTSVESEELATALGTLPVYSNFFTDMGLISLTVGFLMLFSARWLDRIIADEQEQEQEQE